MNFEGIWGQDFARVVIHMIREGLSYDPTTGQPTEFTQVDDLLIGYSSTQQPLKKFLGLKAWVELKNIEHTFLGAILIAVKKMLLGILPRHDLIPARNLCKFNAAIKATVG